MKLERAIDILRAERECAVRSSVEDGSDKFGSEREIANAYDLAIERLLECRANGSRSRFGWLMLAVAYVPTAIFTMATCHFADKANWIPAGVFLMLLLVTLPRYNGKN